VTALILDAWQDWVCRAGQDGRGCGVAERVRPLPPNAQRWHACNRLHGLKTPLVLAGADCKVVAVERGDYLNGEEQRTGDDGKPYMGVVTEHGDGHTDAAVFAAVAVARVR
jgi:hypothetical protein